MHQGIFCDRQASVRRGLIRPLSGGRRRPQVHIFTTMVDEASSLHEANLHVRESPSFSTGTHVGRREHISAIRGYGLTVTLD